MRLYTLLFIMLLSLPAAAERLVIISTPQSGRATVSVVDTPGMQPRTVARLNRPYRHLLENDGITVPPRKDLNTVSADTVLLSDNVHTILVGLDSGFVQTVTPLLRSRGGLEPLPVFRVDGKLASPSTFVVISPDRRHAVVPGFRTTANASTVSFLLADVRGETAIWEQPTGHSRYGNTAWFASDGVMYTVDDTLFFRALRQRSTARPIASGAYCLAAATNLTWAVIADSESTHARLFNLTTLRERNDIVVPERAGQFDFAANGRWLAYEVPTASARDTEAGVYQVDLLTGATDRFSPGRAINSQPSYSPNSSWLCWLEPHAVSRRDTAPLRPTRLAIRHNRRTRMVEIPLQPDDTLSVIKVTNQAVWLAATPHLRAGRQFTADERRALTVRYYRVPWATRTPELWHELPHASDREYEVFVP